MIRPINSKNKVDKFEKIKFKKKLALIISFQVAHYGTKSKKVAKTPNLKILKLVSIFRLMIPKEIYFNLVKKKFALMLKK